MERLSLTLWLKVKYKSSPALRREFSWLLCLGNYERSFAITRLDNFEWSFAITQHAYISKFVLVSLTLFQSTNIDTSLLQTGIKLYLQLYFTSALLLTFKRCSIKVNVQKSRKSHLPVFWKFSIQNLGKSPKSPHTTSEWMNSYCHRLFSLCPLFHFCWKWGVRHSPSFAIPQLSPTVL